MAEVTNHGPYLQDDICAGTMVHTSYDSRIADWPVAKDIDAAWRHNDTFPPHLVHCCSRTALSASQGLPPCRAMKRTYLGI
mmetsp:Transcript_18896/g.57101  ORF Transcript_18896/g.57101 Transcript_18896/m.57101 type:complete len:81 (-) Transcript_18896:163-405(-)